MNFLSTNPLKGMLDYPPASQREFNYIKKIIDDTATWMGYDEYDLPVLESMTTFAIKSSDEILREQSYFFTDRGGREVILRPEITPSLARLVSKEIQNQNYSQPFRWYTIGRCFRYERPQKGRLREFHQLNFDLLGESHFVYDVEILKVVHQLMKNFKVSEKNYVIYFNHRGFVDYLLEQMNFSSNEKKNFFHWVDRKNKMEEEEFNQQIESIWSGQNEKIEFIKIYLRVSSPETLYQMLKDRFFQRFREIGEEINFFFDLATRLRKISTQFQYRPTIVRGFDYYTGVVFEVFAQTEEIRRSLFGGGRYDQLTSYYLKDSISGVGFGMGIHIFSLFLKSLNLLLEKNPKREGYYIAPLVSSGITESSLLNFSEKILKKIYQSGENGLVHPPGKMKKHLKLAERLGYQFVILFGEDEMKQNNYIIKDLISSEQKLMEL